MTFSPTVVARLQELLAAIKGYGDPRRAAGEWKQVYKLLKDTEVPAGRVTGVVGMRDVAGLAAIVDELRSPAGVAPVDAPDEETCRKALQAFRKRLSLTVLDEQSKLGRGPLTKGAGPSAAIVPPSEWPRSVWDELVRQGKLRCIGHGLYELTKQ
ncbi:MAG: hypothetical protein ACE15C_06485 [Phycisphaerae bacterium]